MITGEGDIEEGRFPVMRRWGGHTQHTNLLCYFLIVRHAELPAHHARPLLETQQDEESHRQEYLRQ